MQDSRHTAAGFKLLMHQLRGWPPGGLVYPLEKRLGIEIHAGPGDDPRPLGQGIPESQVTRVRPERVE